MNLKPPPITDDVEVLKEWCDELYAFLQFPTFYQVKLVPRSDAPSETVAGVKYYDSDDDKEKTHNGTDWQNNY